MKTILALCAVTCASLEIFAATAVVYDSSDPQTSYADGAMVVSYGGGGVVSIAANPAAAGDLAVSGDTMTFSPLSASMSLSSVGTLTFANSLAVTGESAGNPARISILSILPERTRAEMEQPSGSFKLLLQNGSLAALTNMTARFSGSAGGLPMNATTCFLEKNGTKATCQFQAKTSDSTLRAIDVELKQQSDGVYIKIVGYGHISFTGNPLVPGDIKIDDKTKEETGYSGVTYSPGVRSDCYVTDFVALFDADVADRTVQPKVSFAAGNSLANVDLVIGDGGTACLSIDHAEAFPSSGSVTVATNSTLQVTEHRSGVLSGVDNKVPITVMPGGTLKAKTAYAFNATDSSIILDGGTLAVECGHETTYDSSVYVHDVTFKNGARTTGERFRVRANKTTWTVAGTSPSSCECGMFVWTESAKSASTFKYSEFTINVGEVAEGTDFFLKGAVSLPSDFANYGYATLLKDGPGTMAIQNAYAMTNMPTQIKGGTFLVDGDWLHSQCAFDLAGGTFAVAAGSTNVCGVLNVKSESALLVPSGALLSFADSSGVAWASAADVVVDADLTADAVRFGTNASGLTALQVRRLKNGDRPCYLDENGYLRQKPVTGMLLLFR